MAVSNGPTNITDSPHLAPISRTTVTDEIVKRLVGLILDESLKPGDKLPSERDLMVRLSVGRSSLREAIKTLSAVGVIEVAVGEGMFVGRGDTSVLTKPLAWGMLMGERSTREVIEARSLVESELAALAAQRATDEEIAEIGQCLETMRTAVHDPELYSRRDLEFHLAIARAGHNRVLAQVLETLRHIVRVWIVKVQDRDENKSQIVDDHPPIYEAIRSRDSEAARRVTRERIERGGLRLEAALFGNHSEETKKA